MPRKPTDPRIAAAEWVSVDTLKEWENNPRKNEDAAWAVARSIHEYGFGAPIVAQEKTGRIIGGHTRKKAAVILSQFRLEDGEWMERPDDDPWIAEGAPAPGMVPVRFLDVDDLTANKLALADNKTGELAQWDDDGLKKILAEIAEVDEGISIPGWSDAEITALFSDLEGESKGRKKREISFEVSEKDPNDLVLKVVFRSNNPDDVVSRVAHVLEQMGIEFSIDLD